MLTRVSVLERHLRCIIVAIRLTNASRSLTPVRWDAATAAPLMQAVSRFRGDGMNLRLRKGKGYELSVFGDLTKNGFDVYLPTVDDQSIDGVLRYRRETDGRVSYFDLQIKGAESIRGTNIVTDKLPDRVILFLYDAAKAKVYWFLNEDVKRFFPSKGCSISDVNWNKALIQRIEESEHAELGGLAERLNRDE